MRCSSCGLYFTGKAAKAGDVCPECDRGRLFDEWEEVGYSRRQIENNIRQDCALIRRNKPEKHKEVNVCLKATLEFWRGEVQDI